jgi:hypothetical protein
VLHEAHELRRTTWRRNPGADNPGADNLQAFLMSEITFAFVAQYAFWEFMCVAHQPSQEGKGVGYALYIMTAS